MAVMTYREALNHALREEMERDDRVFVIGEEVGVYGGAYKVTQGLLKKFGERRVVDTPICESGFTGVGIGAAMVGLRPVVEMMTFNFALLALDQIVNHAAKMHYMSGGQYTIPLVIRGPGGPAHQLAAQHSQSMESYFYHVPGLKVVRPTTPRDAKGLLKSAIRDDNPVIFIESETLYGVKGEVPEDPDFVIPLGVAEVRREGRTSRSSPTWACCTGRWRRPRSSRRTASPWRSSTRGRCARWTPRPSWPRCGRRIAWWWSRRARVRRHGLGDRGVHHRARLRRPRRAGRAPDRRRRADALREEPRAAEDPVEAADRRRDPQALRRLTILPISAGG